MKIYVKKKPIKYVNCFFPSLLSNIFKDARVSTYFLRFGSLERRLIYWKDWKLLNIFEVVYDTTERGMKSIPNYIANSNNNKNDEDQNQCVLQVVVECLELFPNIMDSTLKKYLTINSHADHGICISTWEGAFYQSE